MTMWRFATPAMFLNILYLTFKCDLYIEPWSKCLVLQRALYFHGSVPLLYTSPHPEIAIPYHPNLTGSTMEV